MCNARSLPCAVKKEIVYEPPTSCHARDAMASAVIVFLVMIVTLRNPSHELA
jgi:hypothetical protein